MMNKEITNDSQVLQRALELITRRNAIIDQALKDGRLLSARFLTAMEGIDAEIDDLRAMQIEMHEKGE